ncbi:MAG TPA: hypothetical protein VNL16_07075 [Chloroflexota bacterium]|nr:hypothetical protein [Chloroflexota bacterium]
MSASDGWTAWPSRRQPRWPWALVGVGVGLLLLWAPNVVAFYRFLGPMDAAAALPIVENLDRLAKVDQVFTGAGSADGPHPIFTPDSLRFAPTALHLPRSHDFLLAFLGFLALVLGLSAELRWQTRRWLMTAAATRPSRRPRSGGSSAVRGAVAVWEFGETLGLLAAGLLVVGSCYVMLAPAARGPPMSWEPIDRSVNQVIQALVRAWKA